MPVLHALIDSGCSKSVFPREFDSMIVEGTIQKVRTDFVGASSEASFTTHEDATYAVPIVDRFGPGHVLRVTGAREDRSGTRCLLMPPRYFSMNRERGIHTSSLNGTEIEGDIVGTLPVFEVRQQGATSRRKRRGRRAPTSTSH